MIEFRGKLILLDIEGTVAPLAFVHDVMFPYARRRAAAWIGAHWGHEAIAQLATDSGLTRFANALEADAAVQRLMDADAKVTGLKQLQGLIWEEGFNNGELRSTLFDDVAPAFDRWRQKGVSVRIYSSGSIHAQKLFFAHTTAGDLTPLLSGFYDISTGSKKDAPSYTTIAADCGLPPQEILFISDIVDELNAAHAAGMLAVLAIRPGNNPQPDCRHPAITTFDDITLA